MLRPFLLVNSECNARLARESLKPQVGVAIFAIIRAHPDINAPIHRAGQDNLGVEVAVVVVIVIPIG